MIACLRTIRKNEFQIVSNNPLRCSSSTLNPQSINSLKNLNIKTKYLNILSSFLRNRSERVDWMNPSEKYYFSKVCPQGSCSGPFLWNVFLEGFFRAFRTDCSELVAYADDVLILTWGSARSQLEKKFKICIKPIRRLCK